MDKIIVAASRNRHKIEEIEAITRKFGMKIISRDEAGVPPVEIIEDGETFEENSLKKAEEIMKLCGKLRWPTIRVLWWITLEEPREYILQDLQGKTETMMQTIGSFSHSLTVCRKKRELQDSCPS